MIILICLTLVYIWSQKFREDKNITSLYIPGQNLSQRKAEFNLYETGKPWILSNTDVRVYILKHSISARHSLWKSLRTSVEVVYTKYASKMTTCKEKTKVQTRKKIAMPNIIHNNRLHCRHFVATSFTDEPPTPYFETFRNSPSKEHLVKINY